jgi:hypothetical protein
MADELQAARRRDLAGAARDPAERRTETEYPRPGQNARDYLLE